MRGKRGAVIGLNCIIFIDFLQLDEHSMSLEIKREVERRTFLRELLPTPPLFSCSYPTRFSLVL